MTSLTVTLLSATVMGLLGSGHCIGMCGGIVSAATLATQPAGSSRMSALRYALAYNLGRIVSYSIAGALAGLLSTSLFAILPPGSARGISRVVFAGFTIALGLYLTGWWRGLAVLERIGAKWWARVQPFGRRLLPIDRPRKALVFGLVWGWLPCGLVYTALGWALATGDAVAGALTMAAFGLGTLPSLLLVGSAAPWLHDASRRRALLTVTGLFLVGFGVYLLLGPSGHGGHLHA